MHGANRKIIQKVPLGSQIVAEAAKDLDYKFGDYNGHWNDQEVLYRGQTTQKNGYRADSYSSYILEPGLDRRDNFKVLTHSLVRRILFDEDTTAIGIELERFGETFQYFASKEVVLSAGAIGSPKVLMLSGLGPEQHLRQKGIKTIANIPGNRCLYWWVT